MLERCSHPTTRVCYRMNAAQVRMWCRQCTVCGERVGDWLSRGHPDVLNQVDPEPFDEVLQERERSQRYARAQEAYIQQQAEWRSRRDAEIQQRRAVLEREWQLKYEAYRRSPQWQELRRLVFQRAGGLCEGCGKQQAAQVHHLSYEHMGCEFLWELRAVCRSCHRRVHGLEDVA